MATAEDGYIFKSDAATATSEKSSSGSNKNSDSNISNALHLCASTLISIVLIICVTILLLKFGYGIIFLLCFYMMMKSDDKNPVYIRQKKETIKFKVGGVGNQTVLNSSEVANNPETLTVTKSLINDTREVIKKFDRNEGTSKNSTECISTELAALQKQKESQSLFPDNLSNGKDPESLEGIPACINHRNSHSTNTLDSKVGEQIKDDIYVPKEIAPILKNNSLRRVTYHFNEIQSPTASNTNNGSNNSTSLALLTCLLLFRSGNEATTDKKTIYIHNETNYHHKGDVYAKNSVQGGMYGSALSTGPQPNIVNDNNSWNVTQSMASSVPE